MRSKRYNHVMRLCKRVDPDLGFQLLSIPSLHSTSVIPHLIISPQLVTIFPSGSSTYIDVLNSRTLWSMPHCLIFSKFLHVRITLPTASAFC